MPAITSALLISALIFCIALGIRKTPNRIVTLFVASAIATMLGIADFAGGREIALPSAAYGVLLLIITGALHFAPGIDSRRSRPLLAGLLLCFGLICCLPAAMLQAKIEFPPLEGSYEVGTTSTVVWDDSRGMDWQANDTPPRKFLVRFWYPRPGPNTHDLNFSRNTDDEISASRLYVDGKLKPANLFDEALTRARTNSAWDVPIANELFPLLLFSHGYLGNIASNALLMEQVASHGYIVASISHPGESAPLIFPDGEEIPRNDRVSMLMDEHAQSGLWQAFDASPAERYDWAIDVFSEIAIVKDRLPVWVDDFVSVLDAIAAGRHEEKLAAILRSTDLQKVGFMGMSAGGGAAPAACHADHRCSAVVALDGGIGATSMLNTEIGVDALIFDGGFPSRLGAQDLYYQKHAMFSSQGSVRRVVFPRNGHADFTDTALSLSLLGKTLFPRILPVLGPVDGVETLILQSRLTVTFLDQVLKSRASREQFEQILNESKLAEWVDPSTLKSWARNRNRMNSLD